MERRKFLTALGGATTALLAGCGGGSSGPTATPTPTGKVAATIDITNFGFEPMTVSIDPGQAVEWVNTTTTPRKVVAVSPSEVTGAEKWLFPPSTPQGPGTTTFNRVQPDSSVTRTFNNPGVYVFADNLMTKFTSCGAVNVGDASLEEIEGTLPCRRS